LEEFRAAVRKVRFNFVEAVPGEVDIAGLLHKRESEKELELTLIGTTDEQVDAWAELVGATYHKQIDMNLEDQFIEYTAPDRDKSLFQWEEK
jgi:hypothetical protein